MLDNKVLFSDTIKIVAEFMETLPQEKRDKILVIRDLLGRIRLVVDTDSLSEFDALTELNGKIGRYGCKEQSILCRKDVFDPDSLFNDKSINEFYLNDSELKIRMLDRQVTGQDWLAVDEHKYADKAPRVVFYGFKGGVGRSTALMLTARNFAQKGKKVLVVDLDLESPGLSGLLLPKDNSPEYGLVDWLIEDAIGQGEILKDHIYSISPLEQNIVVVPCTGYKSGDGSYLAKLSRIYGDVNIDGKIESFSMRLKRLFDKLEDELKPDLVLIDSRAGLHDISATSIVGLSDMTYIFATGSEQSWQGLSLLFAHWRNYPEKLMQFRDKLKMVHALFPETDQLSRKASYIENSFELFEKYIYENIAPDAEDQDDFFNFSTDDDSAPHYPVRIDWENRFVELSYHIIKDGIINDEKINASFGAFFYQVANDNDLYSKTFPSLFISDEARDLVINRIRNRKH